MQVSDGIKTHYGLGFGKYLYYKAIDNANSGILTHLPKFMADEMFKYGVTGMAYRNAFEDKGSASYIVMDPNQIKSALGNTGEFSTENPDIRYSIQTPQNDADLRAATEVYATPKPAKKTSATDRALSLIHI